MSTVLGLLGAILVLCLAIGLHEFGHMVAAKKCGVGVVEYSIGMGPIIWHKRKGDTVYSVRLIPFGGYCAMYGEQSLEADNKGQSDDSEKAPEKKKRVTRFTKRQEQVKADYKTDWSSEQAFTNQPWWKKLIILCAGPFSNLALGIIACLLLVLFFNIPTEPTIMEVMEDHPATTSGVAVGDVIVGVDDRDVLTWNDYILYLDSHPDTTKDGYTIRVRRDDEIISIAASKREDDDLFGIVVKQEPVEKTAGVVVKYMWNKVTYMFRSVFDSLSMLVRGAASLKDMSGVVGVTNAIVTSTDEVVTAAAEAHEDAVGPMMSLLLNILGLLSVNLGILNLLPIPALDGGRIVFSLYEGVFRRKVPERVELIVNSVGMILLLTLMGYIVIQDISRIFN